MTDVEQDLLKIDLNLQDVYDIVLGLPIHPLKKSQLLGTITEISRDIEEAVELSVFDYP